MQTEKNRYCYDHVDYFMPKVTEHIEGTPPQSVHLVYWKAVMVK